MQWQRPIGLGLSADEDLEACNLAKLVINAYTTAMLFTRDERRAFEAAVRAWRERNPFASPEQGPPAVAPIICHKL
jgi:hypothetical protein